jgi:hypothetical protein
MMTQYLQNLPSDGARGHATIGDIVKQQTANAFSVDSEAGGTR